ncbi:MAG: DegV family protein [Oscillospiraceae bacterium]|nr:DegV family protein [Oscillospiraceae bacterium]
MKIKISTDSTADIPKELLEELDITSLPLTITMGDREWLDGVTITPQEFYRVIDEAKVLPMSSALSPMLYTEYYERIWREGYTDIVHVCLNSKGSATYQNAVLSKNRFFEDHPETEGSFRIHLLDSLTYSMGYGLAVIEAARMAKNGRDVAEIIEYLRDWLANVLPTCITLDLKCVKKSGRITAAAAFVGGAIGLKPIIQFEDGEANIIAKVRGEKHGLSELVSIARNTWKPGTPYSLICGNNEQANEEFCRMIEEAFGQAPEIITPVGCIIAINTGPNMVGIIFRR